MNIITEWHEAFVLLGILLTLFIISWTAWTTIFRELDYYEIKYTLKTKRRTLWLIFSSLVSATLWLRILYLLLSLLR